MTNPVFNKGKKFSRVQSSGPIDYTFIQFGAKFKEDGEFVGYLEGYDPKLHAEKKPRKNTRSTRSRRARTAEGVVDTAVSSARKAAVKGKTAAKALQPAGGEDPF